MLQLGSGQRLLVANRGEIAARIISSARELDIVTLALYTDNDAGHTYNAAEAIRLSSPAAYLNIDELLSTAKQHKADYIHPGYGFLSESALFAQRARDEGIIVIGPGSGILDRTGDKLRARLLAEQCGVPVLPALSQQTSDIAVVRDFAKQYGYPIMIKAVDGGGGRGIRLVHAEEDLASLMTRAIEESPSKQVFAERAAVDGFRHVEVQIVGDREGNVLHLWERECSIQRRYQKVVELAPSTIDRAVVSPVIAAALKMAKQIRYVSLGTFEFLLNPTSREFFFLEINPRLQVEHTVTESICGIDIVKGQIRLAHGATLAEAGFVLPPQLPQQFAIQLRVTAEDPEKNWVLSAGEISSFRLPAGNGVRVDTALIPNATNTIGTDFDSVVAKVVLTAGSWADVVSKARRALQDTEITGVNTNLAILTAIVEHPDFFQTRCDTQWLETRQGELLEQSRAIASKRSRVLERLLPSAASKSSAVSISAASTLFRKDDAWSIALTPKNEADQPLQHHLRLQKVLKNDFPGLLSAQIAFTAPNAQPVEYLMDVKATTASASALSAQHRRGDPRNPSHISIPFAGKLVELSVDEGDTVKKGECIAVVQQMKMELEVRCPHDGIVTWVCDINDGDDVSEGVLAAIIEDQKTAKSRL